MSDTCMADKLTCKVGLTLVQLTVGPYSGVRLQKFVTEIARESCDKVNWHLIVVPVNKHGNCRDEWRYIALKHWI
jgi:hypothetical protein